jgi:hypothetical protein
LPNAAPTAVTLNNKTTTLPENTDTTTHVKVADIAVVDDGQGTNTITLSGTDADKFEVVGNALYLKAGEVLDYESGKTQYDVTVNVADSTVSGSHSSQSKRHGGGIRRYCKRVGRNPHSHHRPHKTRSRW